MFKFLQRFVRGLACYPVDKRAADKAKLLEVLNSQKYTFRSLKALKKALGTTDTAYVLGLLEEIGTRRDFRNSNQFALVSRVGTRARRRAPVTSYDGGEDDDDEDEETEE